MKKTVSKKDVISFTIGITVIALMGTAIYLCTTAELNRERARLRASAETDEEEPLSFTEDFVGYRSDGGATILAGRSVPDKVIETTKSFMKEKGVDDWRFGFHFRNSRTFLNPQYVVENELYFFDPRPLTKKYNSKSENYIYYVEMIYYAGFAQVPVGYFAIDESGELIESKYIRLADEVSWYKMNPRIEEYEAVETANERMSDDSGYASKIFFNYNIEDTGVLCYSVEFDDGSKVYVNGVTGKIEEIYKALDNATPKAHPDIIFAE